MNLRNLNRYAIGLLKYSLPAFLSRCLPAGQAG